ncbi:hypothetical protein ANCDUO_08585 [Ancylostoma duodenale]|uniref:Uncharacterized protein n=1 Tax=Ancylostoma duodenale TaxID=51022 RepID=A0A0C2GIW4_9BILA|nr:hypothetical protein ANCDUO_08585 [Ancylostoma duodenale]
MDQLQRGTIKNVPSEEISSLAHYLSHHGVIKKEVDDIKIRCVYDGSAKTKGNLSLNDSLYRGPVLLPDLAGILHRIRFYKILISSDIEKVNTIEDGLKFYNESKELFQTADVNLRVYASNATELNHYFEEKEQDKISEVQKLLGLQWNTTTDNLIIHHPGQPPSDVKWTKRKVPKCLASIYDPLGLVPPMILIENVCLNRLGNLNSPGIIHYLHSKMPYGNK